MSHPVNLLPWYQNGTLPEAERSQVAAHLEACAECRAELETLSVLRGQIQAALTSDVAPSESARRRVLQNLTRTPSPAPAPGVPRSNRFADAMRALLAPKWAATAAMLLIVLQSGVLIWTLRERAAPPQLVSRSLAAPTARIRVRFAPAASEAQIRGLLVQVRGRIVDGPDREGLYVIEVLANDAARAAAKAAALRERVGIVVLAEPVAP